MKEYKDIYLFFYLWREIVQTMAPLGQERYCNLAQSAYVERLCTHMNQTKYTLQGCAKNVNEGCARTSACVKSVATRTSTSIDKTI